MDKIIDKKTKIKLFDILSFWIADQDLSYDIYKFIRNNLEDENEKIVSPQDLQILMQWLKNEYELDEKLLNIYEKGYQEEKSFYQKWKNTAQKRLENTSNNSLVH